MLPLLVVDFDGLLNPMPNGWFDLGTYEKQPARDAIKFLIDATEFFEIAIYGPRSEMFGGIQSMQAAIINWTEMLVNKATMYDLMRIIMFPYKMPKNYAVAVTGTGVFYGPTKNQLSQDAIDFIIVYQNMLSQQALSPFVGNNAVTAVREEAQGLD